MRTALLGQGFFFLLTPSLVGVATPVWFFCFIGNINTPLHVLHAQEWALEKLGAFFLRGVAFTFFVLDGLLSLCYPPTGVSPKKTLFFFILPGISLCLLFCW